MTYHSRPVLEVLEALRSNSERGLTGSQAAERQGEHGPNELVERLGAGPLKLLWDQARSTMVLILMAAAVLSALLGKATEAGAIGAIVVLFVVLGFVQEYRAERAMAALKRLAVPVVRVRRGGELIELPARELVPGDIVLLEAGAVVPADARVIVSANLRVQESALTGESEPVEKQVEPVADPAAPLGDRRSMVYMGTNVAYGRGTAVVTATGMQTELGRIAALIQEVSAGTTPLQQQLDRVGRLLAVAGVAVALLVLLIGVLLGEAVSEMFLTAVSVAVAVVPEGLPAVVTITLALGAQRMLRRSALIRKLPAVETLGSVTVICSDKTGTLTVNRMTVTVIDVAGHYLELAGTGEHPALALKPDSGTTGLVAESPPAIGLTLAAGALCNDASLAPDPETGRYRTLGDPTEGALLVAAQQAGLDRTDLESALPRVGELPFDSDRKRMTTVHRLAAGAGSLPPALRALDGLDSRLVAFTKGAVDGLLDISSRVWTADGPVPLDAGWRGRIELANDELAQKGMRVLGLAFGLPESSEGPLERELVLVGLVGMIDPPRPEVREAVATCRAAGIRPLMITGDHPLTARFIAHDLGISGDGRVKTGRMLEEMDAETLEATVADVAVYARVSPEHKLRIVEALQRRGHVVAMTGDGVNDSPALRRADIGIAMGITGTDVSKEASEMVLLDDNFATIVAAVEEGRVIFDNIRRFVQFSIAGNVGKVLVMLAAPLVGIPVALEPLQLLWLNLLTDGLLGLGLGVEPAEKGVMEREPRSPSGGLLSGGVGRQILWAGGLIGLAGLAIAWVAFRAAAPGDDTWQTMLFTTLAFLQVGQALASRSGRESFFGPGWRSNPVLLWLAAVVVGLQLVVVYLPPLERFFNVDPLTVGELAISAGVGSLAFWALELAKWRRRHRS